MNSLHRLRRAKQGVLARRHRRRARVRLATAELHLVPALPLRAGHYANDVSRRLKHRPLLNVQLEEGANGEAARGAIAGVVRAPAHAHSEVS